MSRAARRNPFDSSEQYVLPERSRVATHEIAAGRWFRQPLPRFQHRLVASTTDGATVTVEPREAGLELIVELPGAGRHRLRLGGEDVEELRTDASGRQLDLAAPDLLRRGSTIELVRRLPSAFADLLLPLLVSETPLGPVSRPAREADGSSAVGTSSLQVQRAQVARAQTVEAPLPQPPSLIDVLNRALQLMAERKAGGSAASAEAQLDRLKEEVERGLVGAYRARAGRTGSVRAPSRQAVEDWRAVSQLIVRVAQRVWHGDRFPDPTEVIEASIAAFRARNPHLETSPLQAQGAIGLGERFDVARLTALEGAPITVREISAALRAYSSTRRAYLVWTVGPERGCVYQIIERPSAERLSRMPGPSEIREKLDALLVGIAASPAHEPPELGELSQSLQSLYFGDSERAGLREARLFDLDGRGAEYDQILAPLEADFTGWVHVQAARLDASKLTDRLWMMSGGWRAHEPAFFCGVPEVDQRLWLNEQGALVNVHYTSSHALPGILQAGGLAPAGELPMLGLSKLTGEGTGSAYTPGSLSFTEENGIARPLVTSWGGSDLLEYPLAFALDRDAARALQFRQGTMAREVVTSFLPLDRVPYLFVPHFLVDEIRGILRGHGFERPEVLAFGTPVRHASTPAAP
ncbi:MAG: hypothetical protein IT384_04050 [Deltaproteobacteria bacterium]|nr:hypothetical protein [Deltaproteobacteria bacterium]